VRIISGDLKGRRLNPPKNLPVRPTTDKAKESLFNILNNEFYFDEITVLDLFAGTGSISYEFASRGTDKITSVDSDYRCATFIRKTAKDFNLPVKVIKANVFSFIKNHSLQYDIIFADPPYNLDKINELPDLIFDNNLLAPGGLLIIEHSSANNFSGHKHFTGTRTYSKVNFSFFR